MVNDLPGDAEISTRLVTVNQFAGFIRTENYFREELWDRLCGEIARGGDEVLRRLDFRWEERGRAVTGVSWFEADAYCRWVGGRLPLRSELSHLRRNRLGSPESPEWCYEWYNSKEQGINAFPELPPRKRVSGWVESEWASPDLTGRPISFRLVRSEPK